MLCMSGRHGQSMIQLSGSGIQYDNYCNSGLLQWIKVCSETARHIQSIPVLLSGIYDEYISRRILIQSLQYKVGLLPWIMVYSVCYIDMDRVYCNYLGLGYKMSIYSGEFSLRIYRITINACNGLLPWIMIYSACWIYMDRVY